MINQGLTSYLASAEDIEVLGSASSAATLLPLLAAQNYDVLLLDIQLPDANGIEVCLQVKQAYPNLHILALSNLDDRGTILKMLSNGASGYVLKSASMEEVVQAIRSIAMGAIYLGEGTQQSLVNIKTLSTEEIPPITSREKEVLKHLAAGLSSVQIAALLFVSPLTVDTHRRNLLQKFKVNKTVNLLQ